MAATQPNMPVPPSLWLILIGVGVLSLLMVYTMVQYSRAMLARDDEARGRRRLFGAAYLLSWAGIVGAFLLMFHTLGELTPRNLAILAAFAIGWQVLHRLLVAFARAIQNANVADAPAGDQVKEADEVEPQATEEIDSAEADESEPEVQPLPAEQVSSPTLAARARGWAMMILNLVIVLVVIGIGEGLPPMRRLHDAVEARRSQMLAVTLTAAILGTVMLAGGGAYMAIRGTSGNTRRMTRDEINQLSADVRFPAAGTVYRKAFYRHYGDAEGVAASDEVSFAEMKHAWRTRAWMHSPRWRVIFFMATGAAALTFGLLGVIFTVSTAGVKFLVCVVAGYVVTRITWGMYRA